MNFLFCFKTMEMQGGGYNFVPEKMFSGIKSDFFSLVLLNSGGQISNRDDLFPSGKEIFVTSYL